MDKDLLENTAKQVEERLRRSCLTFSDWDEIKGMTDALTHAYPHGPIFALLSTMNYETPREARVTKVVD